MSITFKNPEDQDGRKKGTLSSQPWLTCVTPTALLGSWVLQPIKDMTSLGTDFETHANWQGYVEVPAVKDFVARKVRLSKMQWTHWNMVKCQECLGNYPEDVVRQGTINLDSQVWKSLGDSLTKVYCIDSAEAYAMQESVRSRILGEKKRCDSRLPNRRLHEKPLAKGRMWLSLVQGSCKHLASRICVMCARNMGAHVQQTTLEYQRYEKTGPEIRFLRSQERHKENSK